MQIRRGTARTRPFLQRKKWSLLTEGETSLGGCPPWTPSPQPPLACRTPQGGRLPPWARGAPASLRLGRKGRGRSRRLPGRPRVPRRGALGHPPSYRTPLGAHHPWARRVRSLGRLGSDPARVGWPPARAVHAARGEVVGRVPGPLPTPARGEVVGRVPGPLPTPARPPNHPTRHRWLRGD